MKIEPEDLHRLPATPERLRHIAADLRLNELAYSHALEVAGLRPDAAGWRRLLDLFLMVYGTTLILAGVAAFFAYNWAELHRLVKLVLLQAGVVTMVWLAWRRGLDSLAGRSALFGAAGLTGVLLAVYGQAYQTGADPYQLFLGWAVLAAGWAVIGRQPALWLLLAALANLALILYWVQVLHPQGWTGELARFLGPLVWLAWTVADSRLALLVFLLNASMVLIWELFAARGVVWMQGRWVPRVVSSVALATVVPATLVWIFGGFTREGWLAAYALPMAYAAFTAACLWYYRTQRHDLYILATCLLDGIIMITGLIARVSGGDGEIALLLSFLVVGQTAAAAVWLRGTAQRWRDAA